MESYDFDEEENESRLSQNFVWDKLARKFNSYDEFEIFILEKLMNNYKATSKNFVTEKLVNILDHDQLEDLSELSLSRMKEYRFLGNMFVYTKDDNLGICYYDYYTRCEGDFECKNYDLIDAESELPVDSENVFNQYKSNGKMSEYDNLKDYLAKNEIDFEDRMYHKEELPNLLKLLNENHGISQRKFQKEKVDRN